VPEAHHTHEEVVLDRLEVIKRAEERGGPERRQALENIVIAARELGCDSRIGGGRAGGMNIRYGSIGYAIMDINTKGVVKLYVQPHPNKDAPDALQESLNHFIDVSEDLEPKSFPINSYGHLEEKVEDIPSEVLASYLEEAVSLIRQTYYEPYLDQPYLGVL